MIEHYRGAKAHHLVGLLSSDRDYQEIGCTFGEGFLPTPLTRGASADRSHTPGTPRGVQHTGFRKSALGSLLTFKGGQLYVAPTWPRGCHMDVDREGNVTGG